jgi:hypothetical protein
MIKLIHYFYLLKSIQTVNKLLHTKSSRHYDHEENLMNYGYPTLQKRHHALIPATAFDLCSQHTFGYATSYIKMLWNRKWDKQHLCEGWFNQKKQNHVAIHESVSQFHTGKPPVGQKINKKKLNWMQSYWKKKNCLQPVISLNIQSTLD